MNNTAYNISSNNNHLISNDFVESEDGFADDDLLSPEMDGNLRGKGQFL